MNSQALALTVILLLGTTLLEVNARYIYGKGKEEARRDWLIFPDAIALAIYDFVKDYSKEAAENLKEIAKLPVIVKTRECLIKFTSAITDFAVKLEKEILEELRTYDTESDAEKKEKDEKKKHTKEKEHGQEKEAPQEHHV